MRTRNNQKYYKRKETAEHLATVLRSLKLKLKFSLFSHFTMAKSLILCRPNSYLNPKQIFI